MKKNSFLQFFVMIFTAFTANTISAQVVHLTTNANNTADTSNHFYYKTGDEYLRFVEKGEVLPGVVGVAGCDATCVANQTKEGAVQVRFTIRANVVGSNNDSRQLFNGPIVTNADYAIAWEAFKKTLYVADVDFMGNTISEMYLAKDLATGKYSYGYDTTGVHQNVNIKKCIVSKQAGKDYIVADAGCGQTFSKATMMMAINGKAKILSPGSTPPNQGGNGNNGNVNTAGGNGNISIPTPQSGSVNLYIIAGNGNGNPVINATGGAGGQGGSVGNTTSTSGAAPSGNGGGNGNGNGANSGNPFGNFIPGGGGNSTTTPPGGGTGCFPTPTITSSAGPDYTKPLNRIASGTQAMGAGSVMTGLAKVSGEVRQWGSIFGAWGNSGGTMVAGGGFQGNGDQ